MDVSGNTSFTSQCVDIKQEPRDCNEQTTFANHTLRSSLTVKLEPRCEESSESLVPDAAAECTDVQNSRNQFAETQSSLKLCPGLSSKTVTALTVASDTKCKQETILFPPSQPEVMLSVSPTPSQGAAAAAMSHVTSVSDSAQQIFICDVCGEQFKTKRTLDNHLFARHGVKSRQRRRCGICHKEFNTWFAMTKHKKAEHQIVLVKCKVCHKQVSNRFLFSHMVMHDKPDGFECDICHVVLTTSHTYKQHVRRHSEQPITCNICGIQLASRKSFQTHVLYVHNRDQNSQKCDVCDKVLAGPKGALERHMKFHGPSQYECEFCDKKFVLKQSVKLHMSNIHSESESKLIECDFCDKTFTASTSRDRHFRHVHAAVSAASEASRLSCDMCEKSYRDTYKLKEHIRTHTGEKPYKCDVCEKAFGRKYHCKKHLLTHLKKPSDTESAFKCDVCDRVFNRLDLLNTHQYRNHKQTRFKCSNCKSSFVSYKALEKHSIKHANDEPPKKCQQCNKTFATQRKLQTHLKAKHNMHGNLKCYQCEKYFFTQTALDQHINSSVEHAKKVREKTKLEVKLDTCKEDTTKPILKRLLSIKNG